MPCLDGSSVHHKDLCAMQFGPKFLSCQVELLLSERRTACEISDSPSVTTLPIGSNASLVSTSVSQREDNHPVV
jgi:hypothetical protein